MRTLRPVLCPRLLDAEMLRRCIALYFRAMLCKLAFSGPNCVVIGGLGVVVRARYFLHV